MDMIKENQLKRVDYHLTISQHNKLRKLSDETGISVAVYIRMAVDKFLKSKKL
jgi:predicted DNA-binding protein